MYWWHLLHVRRNELIYKVYQVQKLSPEPNDWVSQLQKDKDDLNITLTDEQVTSMSKCTFKNYIKSKMECYVAQHFEYIKNTHTKSQNFEKFSGKPQEFLLSKNLNVEEKQNLLKQNHTC